MKMTVQPSLRQGLAACGLLFKRRLLYEEFVDPRRCDPRVRAMALELALAAKLDGFALVVTQVGRTREENIRIYGYDKASGHRERPARAIDFSTRNLHDSEVLKLQNHFSMFLDRGRFWSLLHHNAGHGDHLHLQAPHEPYNTILWEKR